MRSTSSKSARGGDSSQATDTTSNASSLPSVVLVNETEVLFNARVAKVVNEVIFPKKQFIVLERELDETGILANKCLNALNLPKSNWDKVRNIVRRMLNRRRNNAQLSVRRSLLSKYRLMVVSLFFFVANRFHFELLYRVL